MAMPRPSGKALRIAEEVVPGLLAQKKTKRKKKSPPRGSLSEVEIKQTQMIESKEGLQ